MTIIIRNIIFWSIGFVFMAGCFAQSPKEGDASVAKYHETKLLMGTIVQLDVCYKPGEENQRDAAYGKVWERLGEIHWRMSSFDERSDVMKINHAYGKPVAVGADTYSLVAQAIKYSKVTGGVFDITVGPLIKLWKDAQAGNETPSPQTIKNIKESIGVENIRLLPRGNYIEILKPLTRVDLGGIAKGYAVDEAARIFRENGFSRFFIDAGGDIYAGGQNCENKPWRIGIRDPRDISKLIGVVEVTDKAVTTSGDYAQSYEIAGQKWSHIINPLTGYPPQGVVSATVIAPSVTEADVLSTTLCIFPPHSGISLINSLGEEYSGLVITLRSGGGIVKYKSREWKE